MAGGVFSASSVALSEAEVHWRAFLNSLVERGMRGVQFITSGDHSGLKAARKAALGGAAWQRCQFHLAQNAIHYAPNVAIRKRIGKELREIWNAKSLEAAQAELGHLVAGYRGAGPEKSDRLADWLETAIPEGLPVFSLAEQHRLRMRTSNPIERSIQQELKRRTAKGPGVPERGLAAPPHNRRSRRNRRNMGRFKAALHQLEHPGCLRTQIQKIQTSGCVICSQSRRRHNKGRNPLIKPDPAVQISRATSVPRPKATAPAGIVAQPGQAVQQRRTVIIVKAGWLGHRNSPLRAELQSFFDFRRSSGSILRAVGLKRFQQNPAFAAMAVLL